MRTAGQGPGGFEKRDGFIKPGQDLVVAGYAGMAGARLTFQKKKERLVGSFARSLFGCLEPERRYYGDERLSTGVPTWADAGSVTRERGKNEKAVLRLLFSDVWKRKTATM